MFVFGYLLSGGGIAGGRIHREATEDDDNYFVTVLMNL